MPGAACCCSEVYGLGGSAVLGQDGHPRLPHRRQYPAGSERARMGRDLRLGAAVRDGLGNAGVHVANDPTRRLLSSCTGPLRGCDPGLVVGLGAGAALAVTVGGRVAQNAHGAAGEVAYGPISAGAFEGIGSILEEVASDFPRESARPGGGVVCGAEASAARRCLVRNMTTAERSARHGEWSWL